MLLTLVTTWARTRPRVWPGEVATNSLVNPLAFSVLDNAETQRRRDEARRAAPRFYNADQTYLADLRAKLMGLPVAVRSALILDDVDPGLQDQFGLTDASLSVLQRYQTPDGPSPTWRESVDEFVDALWQNEPLLETLEFQKFTTVSTRKVLPPAPIELAAIDPAPADDANASDEETTSTPAGGGALTSEVPDRSTAVTVLRAIELVPDGMTTGVRQRLIKLARYSGFPPDAAAIIIAAIINRPGPTVLFDPAATTLAANAAAARVADVFTEHAAGEVIYARGDVLDSSRIEIGGLALANAGLGAVHGLAGPIGGMFPAPHGAVCAILLPGVMEANIRVLRERGEGDGPLARYRDVARLLTGSPKADAEDGMAWVRAIVAELAIPPLSCYGMRAVDIPIVIARAKQASSMKGNPVVLPDDELAAILADAV